MTKDEKIKKWKQTIFHVSAAGKIVDTMSNDTHDRNSFILLLTGIMMLGLSELAQLEKTKKRGKK